MAETHRARCGLSCPLQAPLSLNLHVFTNWNLPKPCPFGILQRLRYLGVIDSTSSPSPLPRAGG